MQTFRTVIVDNDNTDRQLLVQLLEDRTEVKVIGECQTANEAVECINSQKPDLVFLEIEMPALDGFEIVERIEGDIRPFIVFLSRLNDFALQAFEIHALDYIQKPIVQERVQKSLERLNKLMEDHTSRVLDGDIGDLIRDFKRPKKRARFIIKHSGEYHLIRTKNILWIEADGNYSRVMTKDKKFMVRYTLSGFEEQLDPDRFYRISRSQIVNLDCVVKIRDYVYGNYIVELKNGVSLKMSKNYKGLLDALKNF